MIGFNHAAVGGIIGKLLPLPIAIPAAVASHFILDMLPHYGIPHEQRNDSVFWKYFSIVDLAATVGLGVYVLLDHQPAMFWAGLAACSPDFVWIAGSSRPAHLTSAKIKHGLLNGTPASNTTSVHGACG